MKEIITKAPESGVKYTINKTLAPATDSYLY